ncbi:hypothetical protein RCL1_005554 [Eukaryota sp. TZLM3-RCL]
MGCRCWLSCPSPRNFAKFSGISLVVSAFFVFIWLSFFTPELLPSVQDAAPSHLRLDNTTSSISTNETLIPEDLVVTPVVTSVLSVPVLTLNSNFNVSSAALLSLDLLVVSGIMKRGSPPINPLAMVKIGEVSFVFTLFKRFDAIDLGTKTTVNMAFTFHFKPEKKIPPKLSTSAPISVFLKLDSTTINVPVLPSSKSYLSSCITTVRDISIPRFGAWINYNSKVLGSDTVVIYIPSDFSMNNAEELQLIASKTSTRLVFVNVPDYFLGSEYIHYHGQPFLYLDCWLRSASAKYLQFSDIDEFFVAGEVNLETFFNDKIGSVSFGSQRYSLSYCTTTHEGLSSILSRAIESPLSQEDEQTLFSTVSPVDLMPVSEDFLPVCRKDAHTYLKFDYKFCRRGKGVRKYFVRPTSLAMPYVHSCSLNSLSHVDVDSRLALFRHYRGFGYVKQPICDGTLSELTQWNQ